MIGVDQGALCGICPHAAAWHPAGLDPRCLGTITVHLDSVSGPLRPTTIPCSCTGYKPRKDTMGPQETPIPGLQAVTADLQEAGKITGEATAAVTELTTVLEAARVAYDRAVADAHRAYIATMARIHHAAPPAPPAPGARP